jgi:hypothetical protein
MASASRLALASLLAASLYLAFMATSSMPISVASAQAPAAAKDEWPSDDQLQVPEVEPMTKEECEETAKDAIEQCEKNTDGDNWKKLNCVWGILWKIIFMCPCQAPENQRPLLCSEQSVKNCHEAWYNCGFDADLKWLNCINDFPEKVETCWEQQKKDKLVCGHDLESCLKALPPREFAANLSEKTEPPALT